MNRQRLIEALDQGASVNASLNAHICYRGAQRIDGRYALVAVEAWTLGTELKLRFSVCLNDGSGTHHELLHTVENYDATDITDPVDGAPPPPSAVCENDSNVPGKGSRAPVSARALALELVPRLAFAAVTSTSADSERKGRADGADESESSPPAHLNLVLRSAKHQVGQ